MVDRSKMVGLLESLPLLLQVKRVLGAEQSVPSILSFEPGTSLQIRLFFQAYLSVTTIFESWKCQRGNLRSGWQNFKAPGFRDPRYSSLPWSCPRPPGPEPLPLLQASHLAYQVLPSSHQVLAHTDNRIRFYKKIIHSLNMFSTD